MIPGIIGVPGPLIGAPLGTALGTPVPRMSGRWYSTAFTVRPNGTRVGTAGSPSHRPTYIVCGRLGRPMGQSGTPWPNRASALAGMEVGHVPLR